MNPFKFVVAICVLSVTTLVSSVVVPGASTPLFYLVSSTSNSAANLLPLRQNGGTGGYSTLTGSGPIGQFYFFQGKFVALDSTQSSTIRANIGAVLTGTGCSTFGQLGFSVSSTNKCANFGGTFAIQSNTENSQLGAFLVFNFVGGFFVCGSGQDVWYLADPANGPPGLQCSPIKLYTVPV